MLDVKKVIKATKFFAPFLKRVMTERTNVWPVYGGGMLDRAQYVTSSEIGNCARMIKFGKLASPSEGNGAAANGFKTKGSGGFAERGNAIEAWFVEALREFGIPGYKFMMIGDQQVSFVAGQQSGTPDGVIVADGYVDVLEVKSIDPRFNKRNLPKKAHVIQCIQNWDLVAHNMPDLEVRGVKLIYFDASNLEDTHEFYIDCTTQEVLEIVEALEERAAYILDAERAHDLPAEGIYNKGCTYCKYTVECNSANAKVKVEKQQHDKLSNSSKFFG